MKKTSTAIQPKTTKRVSDRIHDAAAIGNSLNTNSKWSAVQRVRLPHKVGLPLGSGGCGDSIER